MRKLLAKHYKRPESVLVLVYTRGGEVLLLRRTQPRNFWQSVTGSLHWGESPAQAAQRELYEETGIMAGSQLQNLHHTESFAIVPPWHIRYAPDARDNLEHWFALGLPTRRLIQRNPMEHSAYRWVQHNRAARLVASWTNRKAIRLLSRPD